MPMPSVWLTGHQRLRAIALLLALLVGLLLWLPLPAQAAIRQLEEAPGQMLYQTRTTLKDQQGHRWQAIAFKRDQADGSHLIGLRLVGFPGAAVIDRTQPLQLVNALGQTLTARDTSARIFTDAAAPEPHIGQYDLGAILAALQPAIPLELTIPVQAGDPVILVISPPILQEWQQLLAMGTESP